MIKKPQENMKKIGLFLMTEKGLEVLRTFIANVGHEHVAFVVSARDGNVKNDYYDNIWALCEKHGIKFHDRTSKTLPDADYTFAVSWRWLFKNNSHLIVLHDSLLPKYRGFSPLPTALINKEKYVGVTALLADKEFDTGEIVGQRKIKIHYPVKIQQIIELISREYGKLVVDVALSVIAGKKLSRRKQNEKAVTYSLWRDQDDYCIDWSKDSSCIKRFVDAVGYPYAGAKSLLEGNTVRIMDATVEPDVKIEDRAVGKVIFMRDGFPLVVCGRGLLKITQLTDDKGKNLLPLKKFRSRFI